jgi:hypothetical protein
VQKTEDRTWDGTWVDYKKAFDMVSHSWILHRTNMFDVAENMTDLLRDRMSLWKTVLTAENVLSEVNIRRRIFPGVVSHHYYSYCK